MKLRNIFLTLLDAGIRWVRQRVGIVFRDLADLVSEPFPEVT